MNIDHATIITENIDYLLSKWLINDYKMSKFPWYLTPSPSQSDFFYDYLGPVTIAILRNQPLILGDFVTKIPGESMRSIVEVSAFYIVIYNLV